MADQAPEAPKSRLVSIKLENPIVRGTTTITDLALRKPRAGELRGLTLQDIIGSDVVATLKLIPRITNPPLTQEEAEELETEDFAEIGGAIRGFFMTESQRKLIDGLIADQQ